MPSTKFPELPGPKGWPLVGIGPQLQHQGCAFLTQLTGRYGRIVNFPLPGIRGVLVADRDLVKQVLLQTERNFYKGKIYDLLAPVVGRGLVTNQGSSWRRQRRLLNPLFQRHALSTLDPVLDRCTERLLARLNDCATRRVPMDTTAAMMELTFSVLIEAFFSGDLAHRYDELSGAFAAIQSWLGKRFWALFRPPVALPTPGNRALTRAMATLTAAVKDLIAQRRSRPGTTSDLLDKLLAARDQDSGAALSEQEVIDEIVTLLIAGHDTTALTLSFTCALLAENPDVTRRLVAELCAGGPPSPSLTPCILEAMRLYPPAYMINRDGKDSVAFKGYEFPPHTTFFLAQYAVHRDPEYWPDPLAFKPERFAGGEPDDYSFFPFAGGPRTCLGTHLAMLEAVGVMARILPRFVPTRLDRPFKLMANLTAIPEPGIVVWWERTEEFVRASSGSLRSQHFKVLKP